MAPRKDHFPVVVWLSFLILFSLLCQVDFAYGATPHGDQTSSKGSAGSKSSFVTSQAVNTSHFPRITNWIVSNPFLFAAAVYLMSFLLRLPRQSNDQKRSIRPPVPPAPPVPPVPPAPQPTPDDDLSGDENNDGDGTGSLDDIITLEDVIDIDDSGSNDGGDRGSNNGV